MGRQNSREHRSAILTPVLDLFWRLFTTVRTAARSHQELVLENLLLRQQLAVRTRPLEVDRVPGFASGTSCCGSWLADSAPAGASTWRS